MEVEGIQGGLGIRARALSSFTSRMMKEEYT
jgi:hypothetical protein